MAASYMPMSEELEQPGRSWGDIIAERKAFKGYAESAMHKCTLCPAVYRYDIRSKTFGKMTFDTYVLMD